MHGYSHKLITDPVHTTIGISKLEAEILNTKSFQRLRSVKQLGLAHLVFPGADYSRFEHSLGVCHVTGLIVGALNANAGADIDAHTVQRYRLAGLLHDVGHYPFSHAMEEAVGNHYSGGLLASSASDDSVPDDIEWLEHEPLGGMILRKDSDFVSTLHKNGFSPEEIASIFLREDPNRLKNLISSDFDADRIDYLMRTAKHSGLPYGSIDLPYLLTQIRLDEKREGLCLTSKAVRAADHFLLSRYFDYSQITHHKAVAGLEIVLKDVLRDLLARGNLRCSKADMERMVESGAWATFTDGHVHALIEQLALGAADDPAAIRARAITQRRPPKLIWEREELFERGSGAEKITLYKHIIKSSIPGWAKHFDLPEDFWKEWSVGSSLTKIGSRVRSSLLANNLEKDRDRYEQSVMIMKDAATVDIMSHPRSLMSVLSAHEMLKVRLYLIVPPSHDHRIDEIRAAVRKEIPE